MNLKHLQEQIVDIIKKQNRLDKGAKVDYKARTKGNTYQLKVSLKKAKHPIWRRILVQDDITLHGLHQIIQAVMGWTDTHLYEFRMGNVLFKLDQEEDWGSSKFQEIHETREVLLGNVLIKEGQKLDYTYDFGDNWEHSILLEKVLEEETLASPKCLKGKRARPPEDCGGIECYIELVERLKAPEADDEEIQYLRDLDPEHFDLEETNEILSKLVLD
ncbi:plasmid pRiA4b ORF-3 family protein [Bacillus sp. SG-1]|uniref:plasmid pRiA4b ORF-3 family protein n=1 Tax=Bacillus sp. SG-1 TaxID=161544 RepID=UPI000154317F|nr:plasmid pRiA4b ORF-3 family protein [Bacillus sp. SG-1]EDL64919.1 hypothetical protein BSG1_20375 [Bacillus sp. SG-1]